MDTQELETPIKSVWDELAGQDLIGRLKPLLRQGVLYIDQESRKICRRQVIATDTPWIFIRRPDWLQCDLWHNVYYRCMGVIHSKCFDCYKIVIRPRTISELFKVYDKLVELDLPSKAGIEQRSYVKARYGAYIYCKGLESGKETYKLVRGAINEIDSEIGIILKRGCTEFELAHGDSSKYEQKPEHAYWEEMLDSNFDTEVDDVTQPEFLKNHIKLTWIVHAYQTEDPTVLELTGGKDLFPKLKTYHEEGNA